MNTAKSEQSFFLAAVELATPAERAAYLRGACGDDAGLLANVQALLAAHDKSDNILNSPPLDRTTDESPIRERPGTTIGPYKLMEQIGEGGMGLVFVAEQQHPVRRRVALKIIKPGMDSKQVVARFEAERQALAMMDHQNIAKVYDAGTTDSGQPYFVMELVHGISITEYCDANKLTPRQRLELFVPVCQAIQHAHQKGIIHRDVKPSNVLVTMYDDKPVPKVIDFGVAKAVEQRLTDKTVYTQFGTLVGTFEYMSPEQAEMNAFGVDTRSDVYSLGVLLYELLTGTTPLERGKLREAALQEIVRRIKEEEPPRPSTRLSTSGALAKVAAARQTEPGKLSRLVRGELDWVVMRCLEKDRTRRYETANGLARDVERYLRDEPVEACPPSAGYRLRKVARKYKRPLAVAAAFAVLLLAGLALVTWKWQDERIARRDADQARREVEAKAQEILVSDDQMSEASAALDLGGMYVLTRGWADAEAAFNRAIELRPKQSLCWLQRAELYGRMGLPDLAAKDYEQAFARREPVLIGQWVCRALTQLAQGDDAGYRRTCERMLHQFAEIPGAFPRFSQARICALAPGALPQEARLWRLVENPTAGDAGLVWWQLYIRGAVCYRAGRYEEAARWLRESVARTQYAGRSLNHPFLAMTLHKLGQQGAALQELENARRVHDRWVQDVLTTRDRLSPWQYWNDWAEFQHLRREAHRVVEQAPPLDDPRLDVLRGRAYAALGRTDRASAEFARAVQLAPNDLAICSEAFRFHADSKQWAEADAALKGLKRLAPNNPDIHIRAFQAFATNGRWDQAAAEHAAATRLRPQDTLILLEPYRFHCERGDAARAEAAYVAATKGRENDIPFRIQCGNACARFRQWDRARTEYARILDAKLLGDGEVNRDTWLKLAVLQLYFGDVDSYRKTCEKLVERHGDDPNPWTLQMLVRLCLLHPNPAVAPARVHALAERCLKRLSDAASMSLHILALAAERAGKHDTDVAALEAALTTNNWATQRIALAVVCQRRGDFDRARRLMGQIQSQDRRLDPSQGPAVRWDFNMEGQLWYLQAEGVIQSQQWASVRGLVQRKQYEAAIKACDALLPPDHKFAGDWMTRSYCHAQLGHWKEAQADSARALALDPDAYKAAHGYSLICLHLGDREGYRECCRRFLERQAASKNLTVLNQAAWTCVLDPVAEAEAKLALPLIEQAITKNVGPPNRNILHTRACVLYRVGRFEDALKQLNELSRLPGYAATAQDWLFVAMAHQRLGQPEEARKLLDQSVAWMAANRQSEWHRQMELERFRAEATSLIQGGK